MTDSCRQCHHRCRNRFEHIGVPSRRARSCGCVRGHGETWNSPVTDLHLCRLRLCRAVATLRVFLLTLLLQLLQPGTVLLQRRQLPLTPGTQLLHDFLQQQPWHPTPHTTPQTITQGPMPASASPFGCNGNDAVEAIENLCAKHCDSSTQPPPLMAFCRKGFFTTPRRARRQPRAHPSLSPQPSLLHDASPPYVTTCTTRRLVPLRLPCVRLVTVAHSPVDQTPSGPCPEGRSSRAEHRL